MEFDQELKFRDEFPPNAYEEWKKAVVDSLKGADFDKVMRTKTYEGITLDPIYRREDIMQLGFLDNLPGASPYLRGSDPQRFLSEGWLVSQSFNEADPPKLNAEILKELNLGVTAVNLKLAHSDDPRGLKIDSLDTLRAVLNGVDLQAAPLFMQLDISESGVLNWLEQYAAEKKIELAALTAGVGLDPTGELIRKGYLELPLEESWQKMLEAVRWAVEKAPRVRVISIDATIHEAAGASTVQELGFALSTAIGYLQGLGASGYEVDQVAPLFQVKLSLGANFFLEIAKIRAFRLMWAEMIKAFGGNETSQKIWIHGQTGHFNKSVYDTYVNVLRTATEGFAGVIGGVDSLEIGCFDELVSPPSEFSRRIARNQQIILKEEAHFNKVIDPAGGCYYVEAMTQELADKAWSLMQEIEKDGGIVRLARSGRIQALVAEMAKTRVADTHKRKNVFVGVNMYANPEERTTATIADGQIPKVEKAVELEAGPLPKLRAVQGLETLRSEIQASSANKQICLLNMGSVAEYKARADFALGFFQPGGFDVINPDGFATPEEASAAALKTGAAAFCVCSTDDNYQTLVPRLCELLPGKNLILAGFPADMTESYKQQGIKAFIHIRADLYDTLRDIAKLMGVVK